MASAQLVVQEADLDTNGNFTLTGNNFPDQYQFYRLYLTENPHVTSYMGTWKRHNFIHLLIKNRSDISINVDLASTPFYEASITGTINASEIAAFYRNIYYITSGETATGTDASKELSHNKAFEASKKAIAEVNSPYFTIFILAHLGWDQKQEFKENRKYYNSLINDLENTLPDNRYVSELRVKAAFAAFANSNYKAFLNDETLVGLSGIILLLSFTSIVLVILYLRSKRKNEQSVKAVPLTKKEKEVVSLLLSEKSNKEIAATLFIETTTVKSHITSIFQKLNIKSRADLLSKYKSNT
ncbi:MAG TPA: helix-turn-helix transcriptional regulator [Sphingobacteriaceae bacterium]